MSIARMSAGSGYRYVMRQTVTADVSRAPGVELTAYYAATGNPPGRWMGRGLVGLGGGGLRPGTIVTEKAMAALYGTGHDPVTGEQLGRPYPKFKPAKTRIAEAIAGLPDELSEQARVAAVAAIEARVAKSPSRSAVAGYDLTFTVPKSASVLWALGDETVQDAVESAHRNALAGVLELIEDRFLHTRTGAGSCMQVPAQGLIAAAFDHFDSRAGDPHLHTHVVVSNKVQGPDGQWRSIDGQELYRAAVALSETYLDLFADHLTQTLPVSWSWRERGPRRSPVFEIDGITDELLATFSRRSVQIGAELADLVEDFTGKKGREPSRAETLRLRQRATLATRPDKHIHPLAELRDGWRATGTEATGNRVEELLARVLPDRQPALSAGTSAPDLGADLAVLADAVLAGVTARRATWTLSNLLAETARVTRHLRLPDAGSRIALLDRVVEASLARCVALDPPALFEAPARFRRLDGTSVFDRPAEAAFTTTAVLDAEARLLAAVDDRRAPVVPAAVLVPLDRPMPGQRLSPDQYAAVTGIATSARRLDVLVGPAGTGKTRTLSILTRAWAHTHGHGSVLGLAPSATAAAELARALGVPCENTAKWLHETTARAAEPAADRGLKGEGWVMRPGQLVVVDEASMVATAHLDALLAQASAAGAKLLLTGDHHQLAAVEAGGAFGLLAETGHAFELEALWRFRERWEAKATRALRAGEPAALDAYAHHHRLHDGPADLMHDAAYAAWAADLAAGSSSILIAPDRDTVATLNARAHRDLVAAGHVEPDGLPLSDGTTCSRGDVIVTRRNDRRLSTPSGHVRNGDLWRLERTNPDGSIEVVAHSENHLTDRQSRVAVRLPASYVADHVELGYATTIHRAQGATVDTAHLIARPGMTRQQLYVGLTRGRSANHVYATTDEMHSELAEAGPDARSGRQILEEILATDGAEHSATATLRMRQDRSTSLDRLIPIRNILAAAVAGNGGLDPDLVRSAAEVAELIRARTAEQRQRPNHHPPATSSQRPASGPEVPGR